MSYDERYPINRALFKYPLSIVCPNDEVIETNFDKTKRCCHILDDICENMGIAHKHFGLAIRDNNSFGFISNHQILFDIFINNKTNRNTLTNNIVYLRIKNLQQVIYINNERLLKQYFNQIKWNLKNLNIVSSIENYVKLISIAMLIEKDTTESSLALFPQNILKRYDREHLAFLLNSFIDSNHIGDASLVKFLWEAQKMNIDVYIYPLKSTEKFGYSSSTQNEVSFMDKIRKRTYLFPDFAAQNKSSPHKFHEKKRFWFAINPEGVSIFEDLNDTLYESMHHLNWDQMINYGCKNDWTLCIEFKSDGINPSQTLRSEYKFPQPKDYKSFFSAKSIESLMRCMELNHQVNRFLTKHPKKILQRAETCKYQERYISLAKEERNSDSFPSNNNLQASTNNSVVCDTIDFYEISV